MKKLLLLVTIGIAALSAAAQPKQPKYDAIISFHSIGTGVPSAAPITNYVQNFKKKCKLKRITADKVGPFGREGEYRLCFNLTGMSAKTKTKFLSGLKNVTEKIPGPGSAEWEDVNDKSITEFEGRSIEKITY